MIRSWNGRFLQDGSFNLGEAIMSLAEAIIMQNGVHEASMA